MTKLPFPEDTLTTRQKHFFKSVITSMMHRSSNDSMNNPIITVSAALKSVWKNIDILKDEK